MAKFKAVMNSLKLQNAIKELPADSTKVTDFKAFRAAKKDEEDIYIGLYVGPSMMADCMKDQKGLQSVTALKGTIRRSSTHPNKKLVLECSGDKNKAKEVGKESLKASKLNYAIVAVGPGEPEPPLSAEELAELEAAEASTKAAPVKKVSAPQVVASPQGNSGTPQQGAAPAQGQNAAPPQRGAWKAAAPQQPPAAHIIKPSASDQTPIGPTTGGMRSVEGQALMGRVRDASARIKELALADKAKAAPLSNDLKAVLLALTGPDTAQTHQTADGLLKTLEGQVWKGQAEAQTARRRGALHQAMTNRFQIVSQNTFVKGEAARVNAKINPSNEDKPFGTLIQRIAACESSPDAASLSRLESLCQVYIQTFQGDMAATPRDRERAEFVKSQLTHARLAQQALKYQALGDPATWDATQEARAGEMQAAYFFEEGALHAKEGEYGANPLGDDAGLNGSWWIRRVDPADPEGKGSRKFIFKPTDAEDSFVPGFKAGSLAAREVMAKALNDELIAAAGFDVGVCPTTLAEIDSSKLPDADGKVSAQPTRLGSMQQLAEGAEKPTDVSDDALRKIPKDNIDQIAVFDIITSSMDRHTLNVMVGGGPSGTKKFVPIDHGMIMPSKDTLFLNRRRGIQQHAFLDPAMDPNNHRNEPLSPAVKQGLLNLKPGEITAQMKKARDTMRAAHAGMDDDLPDENLQVMQRSIEFLQKACGKDFSLADLLVMTSKYCVDIHEAKPDQLDALVDRIANELPRHKAALQLLEKQFPGDGCGRALQELGWCFDLPPREAQVWAKENAALASKIIIGKIVNPALKKRTDEMIQQLGGPAEAKNMGLKLDTAPVNLFNELKNALSNLTLCTLIGPNAQPTSGKPKLLNEVDVQKLRDLYQTLGGDSAWQKIKAVFPVGKPAKQQARQTEHEKKQLYNQIETLNAWNEFQAAGGPDAFNRLVGLYDKGITVVVVTDALEMLRQAKARQNELQTISSQDEKPLIRQELQQAQNLTGQLPRAAAAQVFAKRIQDLTNQLAGPNPNPSLLYEAAQLRADVEQIVPIFARWETKLDAFRQLIDYLAKKAPAKSNEMAAALKDVNQAFDEGRAADGEVLAKKLDQVLKEATGGNK